MNTKEIIKEIKEILFSTVEETTDVVDQNMADYKVGDNTIRIEGDLEEGAQVLVETEDGFILGGAELAGEHILEGVAKIVVNEEGKITSVEKVEETEETEEVEVEEELEEDKDKEEELEEEDKDKEDKEDTKIKEMESKIKEMESKIEKMEEEIKVKEEEVEKYSSVNSDLIKKLEEIEKEIPAESFDFKSIKEASQEFKRTSKNTTQSNLDVIRKIRTKK